MAFHNEMTGEDEWEDVGYSTLSVESKSSSSIAKTREHRRRDPEKSKALLAERAKSGTTSTLLTTFSDSTKQPLLSSPPEERKHPPALVVPTTSEDDEEWTSVPEQPEDPVKKLNALEKRVNEELKKIDELDEADADDEFKAEVAAGKRKLERELKHVKSTERFDKNGNTFEEVDSEWQLDFNFKGNNELVDEQTFNLHKAAKSPRFAQQASKQNTYSHEDTEPKEELDHWALLVVNNRVKCPTSIVEQLLTDEQYQEKLNSKADPKAEAKAKFKREARALVWNAAYIAIVHIVAFGSPVMTTMNAFAAAIDAPLKDLLTKYYDPNTPGYKKAFAWTSGLVSHSSNYILNINNIPNAIKRIRQELPDFGKNLRRNIPVLVLTVGATAASYALGKDSLAWTMYGAQIANGVATAAITLFTRSNGLINLSNRYKKYVVQGKYEEILQRLLFDDEAIIALTYKLFNESHPEEMNLTVLKDAIKDLMKDIKQVSQNPRQAKKPNFIINKEIVADLLLFLVYCTLTDPSFRIKGLPLREKLLTAADWTFAIAAALAVTPIFSHKCMAGFQSIFPFIAPFNKYLKSIFFGALGAGSPLMYFNAVSQLRPALIDAYYALKSPCASGWEKAKKGAGIVATTVNPLSGLSGWGMFGGVVGDASKPELSDVFTDIAAYNQDTIVAGEVLATASVAATNQTFVTQKALPAPPASSSPLSTPKKAAPQDTVNEHKDGHEEELQDSEYTKIDLDPAFNDQVQAVRVLVKSVYRFMRTRELIDQSFLTILNHVTWAKKYQPEEKSEFESGKPPGEPNIIEDYDESSAHEPTVENEIEKTEPLRPRLR